MAVLMQHPLDQNKYTTITEKIIHDSEYLHSTVLGHYNAKAQELMETLA